MGQVYFYNKKIRYYTCTLSFILVAFTSCINNSHDNENKNIAVTIEPLRFFVEQIVGDRYNITTIVPKGNNPETYEPTASQMLELSKSSLYIKVGNIGFEQAWLKKLQDNVPDISIIDSSDGIQLIESSKGVKDPHTWMSCENAIQIADNIYKALLKKDKQDSLYFKQKRDSLINRISKINNNICNIFSRKTVKAFLIYHPILTYYAKEYGLHQIYIEDEGREPSASMLAKIIKEAKDLEVKTIFTQSEFSDRNTDTIIKETNAQPISIDPLSYDWEKEMLRIAELLR